MAEKECGLIAENQDKESRVETAGRVELHAPSLIAQKENND